MFAREGAALCGRLARVVSGKAFSEIGGQPDIPLVGAIDAFQQVDVPHSETLR